MSTKERNKIERRIEELKFRLENLNRSSVLQSVKEVGVEAIRTELTRVSEPLKRAER